MASSSLSKQQSVSPSACAFPFDQLAPELREMVYETLLVRSKLKIDWKRKLHCFQASTVVKTENGTHSTVPFLGQQGAAILRVSRQINKEALEVLYKKNDFDISCGAWLPEFLGEIGIGSEFVRKVTIPSWNSCVFLAETTDLSCTQKLRSLNIAVDMTNVKNEGFKQALLAFINAAGLSEQRALLDKLSLVPIQYTRTRSPESDTLKMKELCESLERQIRGEVLGGFIHSAQTGTEGQSSHSWQQS